ISDELQILSLDASMIQHKDYKLIKEFKRQANEYKNMAGKYKRNFGKEEREQRKAILNEARKLQEEAEKTEAFISQDIISKTQVILATLTGSAHYLIREKNFSTVFIDEAGQAPEPACWIAIKKANR